MGFEDIVILFIVGLIAGFSAGLIGIGGGLFYVLLYSYFLGKYEFSSEAEFVRTVIANSIFSTFFAALAASYKQIKTNNFYWKPVLLIGIAGLFTSIGMTILLGKTNFYNKDVFAVVFTLAVIPLLYKMLTKQNFNHYMPKHLSKWKYVLTGLISGTGTALSGLGGSFLTTPLLNGAFGLDIRKVISISIGVIVIVAGGTSMFNIYAQTYLPKLDTDLSGIHLNLVVPVVIGVVLAAPYGVKISKMLNPRHTKFLFVIFCISIIVRNLVELIN